jgi:hypothetical protein
MPGAWYFVPTVLKFGSRVRQRILITTGRRFGVPSTAAEQEAQNMGEYAFTLRIRGGLDQNTLDALYAAGCSDMAFSGDEHGPVSADIVVEAPTFLDAVLGTIRQIEGVPGLMVEAVDNDEAIGGHADSSPDRLVPVVNAALTLRRGEEQLTAAERIALLKLVTV